jgi:WD40 repeat protein|tara:strand:- start:11 stop:613 length:603 start_codon:yes stop_codon:yes gene_type:complete
LSKGKAEEAIFKKECAFNSCIFTKEVDKDNQAQDFVYTVGQTQDKKHMAIVSYMFDDIDLKPKVELMLTSPFGAQKFTDVIEVMGPEQVGDEIDSKKIRAKNLVMSSDDGRLVVFGMPPFLKEGLECEVMNCHTSSIIQIKRSEDHKIFVTSGRDGTLFIYRVNEIPNLGYGKFTKQTNDKYFEIEQIERRKKNQKDRVN